jgi:hypothetical protein
MRFARITLGLLLTPAGLLATVAGAASAFWLVGPDNTISTPSRELASHGLAVVTAPTLLDRHGPTLHVTASGDKPLFVGVGQDLDVRDYLAGAAHTRLIRFEPPGTFGTQDLRGKTGKVTPPGDLDWWVARSAPGSQSVSWPMQDGRYDVVVMNADGTPAVGAQVSFGVQVHRLFGICLLVLGAGIALFALGLALLFRRRRTAAVADSATTTEIPVQPASRIPVLVPTASRDAEDAASEPAPAYRVSPFAPERVSPFAPTPAPATTVPAAPMFMSAAAVARAKSPALIGAGSSQRYDEPAESAEPVEAVEPATVPLAASPEFEKSDEAVRRTAALLASGALLLTTTSCGLMPPKNSLTAPDSRPAVTLADAQAVVQHYNQINNQANQTRDAKLSGTIEGNPTLTQTQAGFTIGRKLDAAGKAKSKPFTYTNPEIGAPQFASYPMRFVVSSGVSNAPGNRQLGVWQRENAGSPWLLTHSVYPPKATELPPIDGLRTAATSDLNKLQSQPEAVAKDLAAYLTGGVNAPQGKLFTPSASLSNFLKLRATSKATDTAEPYIASVTDAYLPSGDPLTFITSSGDALVFLSITEQYLQRVEPGSNAYWTSGEATAFSSMVKYTQSLHQDYLHQVALVIPTKTSGDAIRVLSIDPQLIGAGGL